MKQFFRLFSVALLIAFLASIGATHPTTTYAASHTQPRLVDTLSATFLSRGGQDGYITESTLTSGAGGSVDERSGYLRVGDYRMNRQLKGVISFDTSSLPDNAVITSAHIELHYLGVMGKNPFTWAGNLKLDIASPFGESILLDREDFNAPALAYDVATCGSVAVLKQYSCDLTTGFDSFDLAGVTQFRIYFDLADNGNNKPDNVKLESGNHKLVSTRPMLVVEYYIP